MEIRIERNNFGGAWTCGICGEHFHQQVPFSLQIRDGKYGPQEVCRKCGEKHRPDLQWLLDFFYSTEGALGRFLEFEELSHTTDNNSDETELESDDIPF